MRRLLSILALILLLAVPTSGQSPVNTQVLSTTTCPGTGCLTLSVQGLGSAGIQVTGTFVGTLQFEGTINGSTYVAFQVGTVADPTSTATSATAPGAWQGLVGGLAIVRVRFSAFTSGTATVTIQGAQGGGGGAPVGATYVTLSTNPVLTNERVLTAGTDITLTDGGAGSTITIAAAAGTGPPGGSNTQVQFNDSGAFGGDAGFVYDKTTDTVTVAGTGRFAGVGIGTAGVANHLDFAPSDDNFIGMSSGDSSFSSSMNPFQTITPTLYVDLLAANLTGMVTIQPTSHPTVFNADGSVSFSGAVVTGSVTTDSADLGFTTTTTGRGMFNFVDGFVIEPLAAPSAQTYALVIDDTGLVDSQVIPAGPNQAVNTTSDVTFNSLTLTTPYNPFDQDLNTTDSPIFNILTLTGMQGVGGTVGINLTPGNPGLIGFVFADGNNRALEFSNAGSFFSSNVANNGLIDLGRSDATWKDGWFSGDVSASGYTASGDVGFTGTISAGDLVGHSIVVTGGLVIGLTP